MVKHRYSFLYKNVDIYFFLLIAETGEEGKHNYNIKNKVEVIQKSNLFI